MSSFRAIVPATARRSIEGIRPVLAVHNAAVSVTTSRLYSTNIRDAGGPWSEREKANEERYIKEHERDVTAKLKSDLEHRKSAATEVAPADPESTPAAAQRPKDPTQDPEKMQIHPMDSNFGGAVRSGGGAWGKKEAAMEEKYMRDRQAELAKGLKEELAKKDVKH
ncbi:hypothetical protein BJ742DRAFT_827448 [Cladochytrium replicatum]|nr:hypothetical protein BJ742DRAFT_827448 [Cladochytrium replicatum]